jgi:glycosyltransferase involved in cell wall biosynthesis
MVKIILFYSSVKSLDEFERQGFYVEDLRLLNESGCKVIYTNKLIDFLKFNYDIAFLYFYKKATIAAFFARIIKFRKVYFTGGIDDLSEKMKISFCRKLIFKFLFLLCYIFSHKINIVSTSDFNNAVSILKFFRIKPFKIMLFPHSFPILNYQFNCDNKANDFISICWMSTIGNVKRKGLDKALVFFSSIYDILPDSKFYIVGSLGEGADYLKSLDVYEKIKNRVIFTGFLEEQQKNNLLCLSRFYIQFSNYEGFGLAALEANLFKCFIFHSGSGGFLNSNDIWGREISMTTQFDKDSILAIFNGINYFEELEQFNKRFDSFVTNFSSENRLENLKILINE